MDIASTSGTSTTPNEVPIEQLFDLDRLPTDPFKLAMFMCYAPVGCFLFILRIAIGVNAFVASCILPRANIWRCYALRLMCALLGVVIRESGKSDPSARVIVANHVSSLDHTAISLLQPCVIPNVWSLPALLTWAFGYTDMGAAQGRQTLVDNARKFCQTTNVRLLALPETAMTNGRAGLLQFSNWPFALDSKVQPCAIRTTRPIVADISVTRLGSRWWTDLVWFLFVPYTVIHITWLPALTTQLPQTDGPDDVDTATSATTNNNNVASKTFATQLAQQCANAIGQSLHIQQTRYTSKDAVDFAKRVLLDRVQSMRERRQQETTQATRRQQHRQLRDAAQQIHTSSSNDLKRLLKTTAELDAMTYKVKELCPSVPLLTIHDDIAHTLSVAITVSRITDGAIVFTPCTCSQDVHRVYKTITAHSPHRLTSINDSSSWSAIFNVRKWELIERERWAYMERNKIIVQ